MRFLDWLKFAHLLGAAIWTGGLITLAVLVTALRRAGADRALLQAAARRFGAASWSALGVLVVTGIWQVQELSLSWTYDRLVLKITLVVIAAALAGLHQVTARRSSPALRGALQGLILVVSIGIFAAAVRIL